LSVSVDEHLPTFTTASPEDPLNHKDAVRLADRLDKHAAEIKQAILTFKRSAGMWTYRDLPSYKGDPLVDDPNALGDLYNQLPSVVRWLAGLAGCSKHDALAARLQRDADDINRINGCASMLFLATRILDPYLRELNFQVTDEPESVLDAGLTLMEGFATMLRAWLPPRGVLPHIGMVALCAYFEVTQGKRRVQKISELFQCVGRFVEPNNLDKAVKAFRSRFETDYYCLADALRYWECTKTSLPPWPKFFIMDPKELAAWFSPLGCPQVPTCPPIS
jgi:hypothetical protein